MPASDLVPGDVVLLGEGDVVPADCEVLEAASLLVDESALTGESVAVGKVSRPRRGAGRPALLGHGRSSRDGPSASYARSGRRARSDGSQP